MGSQYTKLARIECFVAQSRDPDAVPPGMEMIA